MTHMLSQPQKKTQVPAFTLKPENRNLVINWLSGLSAGLCAITIFSPLDLARTRHIVLSTTKSHGVIKYNGLMQTLYKICADEGFKGLYKGYAATALTVPIFHSIYFSLFYKTKNSLNPEIIPENRTVLRDMIASLYAGFVANTVTNPLWIVKTRIQSQFLHKDDPTRRYTGVFQGLKKLVNEEGYRSLSKGLLASYLGMAHGVILFPLYEYLKGRLSQGEAEVSSRDVLIASNISKIVAMTLTYPHIVVRARLQDAKTYKGSYKAVNEAGKLIKKSQMTISSVVSEIWRKEGMRGLFSGFRIDLVRVLPANSVTFLAFEYIKKRLEETLPRD